MTQSSNPTAVLISDVHFSMGTLELAKLSLETAVFTAHRLKVPLIIAGDLNDTKAILRAECVSAILNVLNSRTEVRKIVLVGNHDLINEKSKSHSLEFLNHVKNCEVVDEFRLDKQTGYFFIPYQSDTNTLRELLNKIPSGSTIIAHQGLMGAHMGEYVVDKSSIEENAFANFRTISGHYHRHQDIKCGRPRKGAVGLFTYIGSPYSITFAESSDGPKGIQVLNSDGLLEQIPTGLRKHVQIERSCEDVLDPIDNLNPNDLLWIKVHGPASKLDRLDKKAIGKKHLGHETFKLDKIYDESEKVEVAAIKTMTDDEILDHMIDSSEETIKQKKFLKSLWREIIG